MRTLANSANAGKAENLSNFHSICSLIIISSVEKTIFGFFCIDQKSNS